jgi:tetrahydromethanopterin S-methyltransferase subunit G
MHTLLEIIGAGFVIGLVMFFIYCLVVAVVIHPDN